jgi:hypothetical protein
MRAFLKIRAGCLVTIALLSFTSLQTFAQSAFVPLDNNAYDIIDRMEIKSGKLSHIIFSDVKPYTRMNADAFAEMIDSSKLHFSLVDRKNLYYIFSDNGEWYSRGEIMSKDTILKYFYQTKADLYSHVSDAFMIKVNPEFNFTLGGEPDSAKLVAQNSRGFNVRGWIDKKVGFYADFLETDAYEPGFEQALINENQVVPGAGRYIPYGTRGVDYSIADGYFDFTVAKYILVQFGQDKNFIGDGYRSLFLSDFSNNYLFLKLSTQVWKFNYENLFMQLTPQFGYPQDSLYPKKYAAIQHLSYDLTKFLNVGLFDAVVYTRTDHFDFSYLNPIIFYDPVEYGLGSSIHDNALIGFDYKANFLRHFSLYGQFLLDDYNYGASQLGSGYYGDKYANQIGLKWIDVFGISNLDLQFEYNLARPYTYSHDDALYDAAGMPTPYTVANYSNYNEPLADPLGANFHEYIGIIRYQPLGNLFFTAKFIYSIYGSDEDSINYGNDIFLNYTNHPYIYGNIIGQGVKNILIIDDFTASYMIKHNLFLDLRFTQRNLYNALSGQSNTSIVTLTLRMNLAQVQWDY